MSDRFGHYRVVKREAHMLRLERKCELPLLLAALGGVLLVVLWFLSPWRFIGGLMVSLALLALSVLGIVVVLRRRPWKEVLVLDRAGGHLTREERYLLRSTMVNRLPLDTIAGVSPQQRMARLWDKRGHMVEHAYWAVLLRSTTGEEMELDAANSPEQMRELAGMINGFIADFRQ